MGYAAIMDEKNFPGQALMDYRAGSVTEINDKTSESGANSDTTEHFIPRLQLSPVYIQIVIFVGTTVTVASASLTAHAKMPSASSAPS